MLSNGVRDASCVLDTYVDRQWSIVTIAIQDENHAPWHSKGVLIRGVRFRQKAWRYQFFVPEASHSLDLTPLQTDPANVTAGLNFDGRAEGGRGVICGLEYGGCRQM